VHETFDLPDLTGLKRQAFRFRANSPSFFHAAVASLTA